MGQPYSKGNHGRHWLSLFNRHVDLNKLFSRTRLFVTGFGANRLQARLATRKAKPAGQYYLEPQDVESYMSEISLADLPGVGRATLAKLHSNLNFKTCGDVQEVWLKLFDCF